MNRLESGIYQIKCHSRIYVGQAQNIRRRFHEHRSLLRRGRHFNPHLQRLWNLAGEASFVFEALLYVPEAELTEYEQVAIDSLESTSRLNMALRAEHASRGIKRSPEARQRMSDAQRRRMKDPAQRQNLSLKLRGLSQSAETRLKRSIASKGRIFTAEHRAKISAAKKKQHGN